MFKFKYIYILILLLTLPQYVIPTTYLSPNSHISKVLSDANDLYFQGTKKNHIYSFSILINKFSEKSDNIFSTLKNKNISDQIKKHFFFGLHVLKNIEVNSFSEKYKDYSTRLIYTLESSLRKIKIEYIIEDQRLKVKIYIKIKLDELKQYKFEKSVEQIISEIPFLSWRFAKHIQNILYSLFTKKFTPDLHLNLLTSIKTPNHLDGSSLKELIIPGKFLSPPNNFSFSGDTPIYILVNNWSKELGWTKITLPAIWKNKNLHWALPGFNGYAFVEYIYSFPKTISNNQNPLIWKIKNNGIISLIDNRLEENLSARDIQKKYYEIKRKISKNKIPFVNGSELNYKGLSIEVAPMVRYTDIINRIRYAEYSMKTTSEMILIGDLILFPGETISEFYQSINYLNSVDRATVSIYEPFPIAQIAGPHQTRNKKLTKYQFGSDNILGYDKKKVIRTFLREAHNARLRGVKELNINVCCPAAIIEQNGGGIGLLQNSDLLVDIIKALKAEVKLSISIKMILPNSENKLGIPDVSKSIELIKKWLDAGLNRLIIQGTSDFNTYHPNLVKKIVEFFNNQLDIIYNGNIHTLDGASIESSEYFSVDRIKQIIPGIKGVMVGRSFMGTCLEKTLNNTLNEIILLQKIILSLKQIQEYYRDRQHLALVYGKLFLFNFLIDLISNEEFKIYELKILNADDFDYFFKVCYSLLKGKKNKKLNLNNKAKFMIYKSN